MSSLKFALAVLFLSFLIISCEKDDDIDTEKPTIDNGFTGAFPANCDTLYFGESFELKIQFTDNSELGSYSISIHDNFDHHSHSTEVTACELDPIKEPINSFTFIEDYTIPEGSQAYETDFSISIPTGNENGLFDDGDYHFFISLTDKEGWSDQKGLSIKMLHR